MTDVAAPDPSPVPYAAPRTPTASDASAGSALGDLTRGPAGAVLLVVLVFVCYATATQFGFVWDDDAYVTNNPTLRSFAGLSRIWTDPGSTPQYYPVTFTSFWLEARLFGISAKVSHATNLLLHLGSVLLLWKILRRLGVPGAWAAAAVFGVHPIQVESVAWVAERKNTLSMLLGLSALWTYLRYAGVGGDVGDGGVTGREPDAAEGLRVPLPGDPKRLYRLFLALFVLALLAKTTMAVLPGVIAVVLWWKRGRLARADWLALLPAVALGLAGGLVTSWVEHNPYLVGATGPDWALGPLVRLQLAGQTTLFYAGKILWPVSQNFNYFRWTPDPRSALQWLPLAGVLGVVLGLAVAVPKTGRGPLAATLVFLGGCLPACGLFTFFPMRFSWVADHFAYVGSVGLITGVTAGVTLALRRLPRPDVTGAGVVAAAVVPLVVLTVTYSLTFRNPRTLWQHTYEANKRSWLAAVNLGVYVREQSAVEFATRVQLGDPDALTARETARDKAAAWVRRGLQINPDAFEAEAELGTLALQRGRTDEALDHLRRAKAMAERAGALGYQGPAFQVGEILAARGDADGAELVFTELEARKDKLLARNPNSFARLYTVRGDLARRQVKGTVGPDMSGPDATALNTAMDFYVRATEAGPDFLPPKLRLATLLLETNNPTLAMQQIYDVVKLDKNNVEAKFFTAQVAQKQGLYEVAANQLVNLLQTDPSYLPGHLELARVYRAMNRPDDAIHTLEVTLRFMPDAVAARQLLDEIKGAATRP